MLASTLLSFSMAVSDGGWDQPPHRWQRNVDPGVDGGQRERPRSREGGAHARSWPLVTPRERPATMRIPLSVLDLAPITRGGTATDAIAGSVGLARRAEETGYQRVWYAEHHNMPSIASSATSVLIAHVGAHTSRIRLGAGGVMLPNHSPLTIAEQFGTLDAMYPGRIDL